MEGSQRVSMTWRGQYSLVHISEFGRSRGDRPSIAERTPLKPPPPPPEAAAAIAAAVQGQAPSPRTFLVEWPGTKQLSQLQLCIAPTLGGHSAYESRNSCFVESSDAYEFTCWDRTKRLFKFLI